MNKNPSQAKLGFSKLLIFTFALWFCLGPITMVKAQTSKTQIKQIAQDLGYEPKTRQSIQTQSDIYIRIKRSEFEEIERQAFMTTSLLSRVRDLERLYTQVKDIIETIKFTIDFIKKILNIDDAEIGSPELDDNEFEHISGVVMSPGFVEIEVSTNDPNLNFEDLVSSNFLEFDLYYNKGLFTIDHIEGKAVYGEEFKTVALPQKTSAAKDRIKLPLSDVLTNIANFRIYLAPLDHEEIEIGDSTKLDVRYYKRVAENEEGERIPPLDYHFSETSANEIVVVDKRD